MPDDITPGELDRRLDRLAAEVKDDLHAMTARLDGKVRTDVFKLEQGSQDARLASLSDRIASLEKARADDVARRAEDTKQRVADRRWLLAVLIFPVVLIVISTGLQILLAVLGVL